MKIHMELNLVFTEPFTSGLLCTENIEFECWLSKHRGAEDFGSSSSQEKSKIEVQKVEGVVKPNVSPSKKKENNKDGKADGEGADGDTAKKKGKEKEDEVRLNQIHHESTSPFHSVRSFVNSQPFVNSLLNIQG